MRRLSGSLRSVLAALLCCGSVLPGPALVLLAPACRQAPDDLPTSPVTLAFATQPAPFVAGSAGEAVVVTVLDREGRVAPHGRHLVTLALADAPEGVTLFGRHQAHTADGRVTFEGLSLQRAGRYRLTAEAADLSTAVSQPFDVVAGSVSREDSTFVATAESALADATQVVFLAATARDVFGNPVDGVPVLLSATGSGHFVEPTFGLTREDGRFVAAIRSSVAGSKTVLAAFGEAFELDAEVTFTAGPPAKAKSSLHLSTDTATADGEDAVVLTLVARDAQGNVVAGAPVFLSSSGSDGADVFDPAEGATDDDGIFSTRVASRLSGRRTFTATVGDHFDLSAEVTFLPGAVAQGASAIRTDRALAVANGGDAITVTVIARDAEGNPVPGATVWLSSGRLVADVFDRKSGATDAAGTFTARLTSRLAGTTTVSATIPGLLQLETTAAFTAGAPVQHRSTVAVTTPGAIADGSAAHQLVITARDAEGNLVPGATVAMSSGTPNAHAFAPLSGVTDAGGTFTTSVTSTVAGSAAVSATVNLAFSLSASMVFAAGPPSQARSGLAVSPGSVLANGTAGAGLVVTARDAQGNPVPGVSVLLRSGEPADAFGAASGVTNASGQFTTSVTSTTTGTRSITAQLAGSFLLSGAVTFLPGPPSQARSTLLVSAPSLTADGAEQVSLTVLARDAHGNAVPGATVSLSTGRTQDTFSAASGTTSANGVFMSALSSTRTGPVTVTATVNGTLYLTGTVTFLPGPVARAQASFSVGQSPAVANGNATVALAVTARDAFGNAVPGAAVTLRASDPADSFSRASGTTDASGVFTAAVSSTLAGSRTMRATVAEDIELEGTAHFVAGPPTYAASSFTAAGTATADGVQTVALTLTARDTHGNAVTGAAVALTSSRPEDELSPPSGATGAGGVYVATLSATVAGARTVTARLNGNVTLTLSATLTPGAAVAEKSTFVVSPGSAVASGNATLTLTVTARDAYGNTVPGASVALSSPEVADVFGASAGSTGSTGAFATTLSSTRAGTRTIRAAVGGAFELASPATFVAGAPTHARSTLAVSGSAVADGTQAISVTVTARDAHDNPVPGAQVSLATGRTADAFVPASGSTGADGVFTASLTSTRAGAINLTATIAGVVSLTVPAEFLAGAPALAQSLLAVSPAAVVANGTSTLRVTVTARDAQGNAVPGASVELQTGEAADVFEAAGGVTNASGVFSTTLASTRAGSRPIRATVAGALELAGTVTFNPGPLAKARCSLVVSGAAIADGSETMTVTVTARDAYDNVIPGASVALSTGRIADLFAPASGSTAASGVFAALLSSTASGTITVTALVGGVITLTTAATFLAGEAVQAQSTFGASPASVVANGLQAVTLTVTARDARGNPVPGVAVELRSPEAADQLGATSGVTNASGEFSTSVTSTRAGTRSYTAELDGRFELSRAVTFTPGAASQARSSLEVTGTAVADGTEALAVRVVVRDAHDNLVPGASVLLSTGRPQDVLTPASGATTAMGEFTSALTSTRSGSLNVTATVASAFSLASSAAFSSGPPARAQSTLAVSAGPAVADGSSALDLVVTVRDANGNPVPGAAVLLTGEPGDLFAASGGATDASGVFATTVASTRSGTRPVAASVGGAFSLDGAVSFVAGPASPAESELAADPGSAAADGTAAITLTLTARDAFRNPVAGGAASLSTGRAGDVFSPASGSTSAGGVFVAALRSTEAGEATVTARVGGSELATVAVSFSAGSAVKSLSSLTVSPGAALADGSATLELEVIARDAFGNPVPGTAVAFVSEEPADVFSPTGGSTGAAGRFTATVASTAAGSRAITAVLDGDPARALTAQVRFLPGAPDEARSSFTATPAWAVADAVEAITLAVTIRDAAGNPVPDTSVALAVSGSGHLLSPEAGITDEEGAFTARLRASTPGLRTVRAVVDGFELPLQVTFAAAEDAWVPTSLTGAPTARRDHAAVWTGSEMIVWGGVAAGELSSAPVRTGAKYDPATDTWLPITTSGAPTAREQFTAVWADSAPVPSMIVWGGRNGAAATNTGGRYDPVLDEWSPTRTNTAPTGRWAHTAVWTGSELVVWGGTSAFSPSGALASGARYDPGLDQWSPTRTAGAPTARSLHSAVWTGSRMIVWGGQPATDTGALYDAATDEWEATAAGGGALGPRYGHTAVWTGSSMLVWGGWGHVDGFDLVGFPARSGARYHPPSNTWTPLATAQAPEGVRGHSAVWTGASMIVWGGHAGGAPFGEGAAYDPASGGWTPLASERALSARSGQTAVWTGSAAVVWGGADAGGELLRSGARYLP